MIENLIGLFDNLKNYNLIGGDSTGETKKKKVVIKKTKYTIYNMIENKDNLSIDKVDRSKYMKTLLIPLSNANTVTVGIFINSGSRQETEAFGIAHFLEHMTFKGTLKKTSTDLMIELDSIGANYNALTGHEFTLYYLSGDPRDIERFLEIIIDLYLFPIYPEADIEKERNVVLEELRMNDDSNGRVLSKQMFNEIYDTSKPDLARPIIGYKESISILNRDDIMTYRSRNYNGSNCLLCVSGNFERDEVINKIEKCFGSKLSKMSKQENLFFDTIKKENKVNSIQSIKPSIKRHININKDINQTIINFTFNAYAADNYYINHLDLVSDILSNGFSSRLFDLLRNKMGVSYYNNSFTRTFEDCGQFIIVVGVDHKSVKKTIKCIINELKNIIVNGVTAAELAKSKKQNETSLLFQFKDPYEYLMYYGLNYLKSKPLYNISDMLNNIDNIQLNEVNSIIKEIFKGENLIIGTIGKVSDTESKEIIEIINSFG